MGFWIFMLIVNLITPLIMILGGVWFVKRPPKNINSLFGYRTSRSMKNQNTWNFAHHFCGRLWLYCGLILFPVSAIPMLLLFNKSEGIIATVGLIICVIHLIVLLCSIIPTENALKKHFDDNGNEITERG